MTQETSDRLVIERLLTPGSIRELAMRRCILEKDTLRFFSIGAKSLSVVVASLTRLANRTLKVLCIDVVGQMRRAWFIWTKL